MFDGFDGEVEDDSQQRPSVGQMIAGAKMPSAMPSVAQPPVPDSAPSVRMPLDPNAIPQAIRPRQLAPNEVAQPASPADNPNLVNLAKEQARLSKPINPYDSSTGKLLPQYKMGVGSKILYTISNALQGFGAAKTGQHFTPVDVGPGATNWKFGREEEQRKGELAGVNEQLGTQEKLQDENEKLYRDAIRQAYEGQVGEARKQTSEAQQENAATKASLAQSQKDLNEARANKANQDKPITNDVEAAAALEDAKAKGDKAGVAKWTGVLAELRRQKAAGKDTTNADLTKTIQVAEFRSREHDRIDQQQETERRSRYAELDKDMKLKYSPQAMQQAKAAVDGELKTKYDPKHQKVDSDADGMLGLTKSGKALQTGNNSPQPNSRGASNASKPAAKPNRPAPKVGDTIKVDGKSYKVTGINPKTKKPIVEPAG